MRRAAKVDANQPAIVAALRSIGVFVEPLHQHGRGVPDLLCGFKGQTLLIEVKDGKKPPSERKLTPEQEKWHEAWTGGPVYVVTDVTQAVGIFGVRG